jgi:hypothetical protein
MNSMQKHVLESGSSADLSSWASKTTTNEAAMSPRPSDPRPATATVRSSARSEKLRALPPVTVTVQPDVLLSQLEELRQRILSAYPQPPASTGSHQRDLFDARKAARPPNRRALMSPPDVELVTPTLPGSVMLDGSAAADPSEHRGTTGQLTEVQVRALVRDEVRVELAALRDLRLELDVLKERVEASIAEGAESAGNGKRAGRRSRPGSRERVAERTGGRSRPGSRERAGRRSRASSREHGDGQRLAASDRTPPASEGSGDGDSKPPSESKGGERAVAPRHGPVAPRQEAEATERIGYTSSGGTSDEGDAARGRLQPAGRIQMQHSNDGHANGESTPGSQSSASHGRPGARSPQVHTRSTHHTHKKGFGYRNRDPNKASRRQPAARSRVQELLHSSEDENHRSSDSSLRGGYRISSVISSDTDMESSVHSPLVLTAEGAAGQSRGSASGLQLHGIKEVADTASPTCGASRTGASAFPGLHIGGLHLDAGAGGALDDGAGRQLGVVGSSTRHRMFPGPPSPGSPASAAARAAAAPAGKDGGALQPEPQPLLQPGSHAGAALAPQTVEEWAGERADEAGPPALQHTDSWKATAPGPTTKKVAGGAGRGSFLKKQLFQELSNGPDEDAMVRCLRGVEG